MIRLRPVLQKIYENLVEDAAIWDLCCDHGYVGRKALHENKTQQIHLVDVSRAVIENLLQRLSSNEKIMIYQADAASLERSLEGNVIITGVGSHTMIHILQSLKLKDKTRLFLSPNNKLEMLSDYLKTSKWDKSLIKHQEIKEKNRIRHLYTIDYRLD